MSNYQNLFGETVEPPTATFEDPDAEDEPRYWRINYCCAFVTAAVVIEAATESEAIEKAAEARREIDLDFIDFDWQLDYVEAATEDEW